MLKKAIKTGQIQRLGKKLNQLRARVKVHTNMRIQKLEKSLYTGERESTEKTIPPLCIKEKLLNIKAGK